MKMDQEKIVIATSNCEKAFYLIGKTAVVTDTIEVNFVTKYAPTVEYILRMFRKGCGWKEIDRDSKETVNTRCKFKEGGLCKFPEKEEETKCNEAIRVNCKDYLKKFDYKIMVNTITIEKLGAIRGS